MFTEIIRMFKEKNGFVSGEEMSRRLGITRAGIWKKIGELRSKGYKIQGSTAKGYKLIKTPEFSVEELRADVRGDISREIVFLDTIDSTNRLAMELAEKGSPHGTVVIADSQTKGKGRLGRTWVSPPKKNIYMSIILRPEIEPKDATLLTIMSAVSCASALINSTGLNVKIKWPNDLMVSDKKLGGILTEMKSDPDRIISAVIGIGINVSMNLKDFPSDVRAIATSVRKELGKLSPPRPPLSGGGEKISRTRIVAEILKEMNRWYDVLIRTGRRPLLDEWKRLSSTLYRDVRVTIGKDTFTGVAEDIDDDGMLILRFSSGMLKKISAGDLTLLR